VTLRDRLWEAAAEKGAYMMQHLNRLREEYPDILARITGKGLLIGMHFKNGELGYKAAAGLFKRGVLVAGTLISATTIRIEPPLVITYEQMDQVLDRLEDTLKELKSETQTLSAMLPAD